MKFKQPSMYDLKDAVEVWVGESRYFVYLESEIVVQEVSGRGGRRQVRRVTSRRIETEAILKASDKVNA